MQSENRHLRSRRSNPNADVNPLIRVKFGVDALRTVRTSLIQLAYDLVHQPGHGFLVLADAAVTEDRLRAEWESAKSVLRPDVLDRLTICLGSEGSYHSIPTDLTPQMQRKLDEEIRNERPRTGSRLTRTDFSYVIFKILLYRWLTKNGEPVTAKWLAETAGCSYPTLARALSKLGSLVDRKSDRSIIFRYFPREELFRILAVSDKVRPTFRFVDRSGQPRSPEAHVRRLEKLNLPELAVGGVLGARHYYSELDLVGTPRLDLSLHSPSKRADLTFIEKVDPALREEKDPLKAVNVVVHVVRHRASLFKREGGVLWADPVECLLDLYEARLEAQATEFLSALQRNRSVSP